MITMTLKQRRQMGGRLALCAALLVLAAAAGPARAQEHPREHPQAAEQPKPVPLTMEVFAKAVDAYVKRDAALKGGYFLLWDPVDKKALLLTLDKVHRDKLSQTGEMVYFACADFKTPEGQVYDVDVFMKGTSEADLVATEITVHKIGGQPRYTWTEERGIWKKKPVAK